MLNAFASLKSSKKCQHNVQKPILWCEELACDWLQHNKHANVITAVMRAAHHRYFD